MTKNDKKPRIRFKGFTDAWEQRELDDLLIRISTGLNPRDNFVLNSGGKNYYVTIKNFEHGHLYLDDDCDKVDDEALQLIQQRSDLRKDDILFTSIGRVGDCYLIEDTPKNWNINESVFTLRPNQNFILPLYLFHTIHSDKVLSQILSNITGSTFKSIKISDLKKAIIPVTSFDEQAKISRIISNIDNLITLHQRKYDKLVDVKKSLLEKMFPQGEENTPKIRFKGFTETWEQRKLGEVIIEYKETVTSECTLPVLTSSKSEGVILQEEHFGRKQNHDITGYNVLPKNYCTYRNRSDGVDFTFNINKCCEKGIISKFYPVFCGKNNDTNFISLVLNNSEEVIHEIGYTCTGTGQKVLSFLDLQKMSIRLAENEEQKKISIIFEALDKLITLHQRKLEKLKNIKSALLEKMFV